MIRFAFLRVTTFMLKCIKKKTHKGKYNKGSCFFTALFRLSPKSVIVIRMTTHFTTIISNIINVFIVGKAVLQPIRGTLSLHSKWN